MLPGAALGSSSSSKGRLLFTFSDSGTQVTVYQLAVLSHPGASPLLWAWLTEGLGGQLTLSAILIISRSHMVLAFGPVGAEGEFQQWGCVGKLPSSRRHLCFWEVRVISTQFQGWSSLGALRWHRCKASTIFLLLKGVFEFNERVLFLTTHKALRCLHSRDISGKPTKCIITGICHGRHFYFLERKKWGAKGQRERKILFFFF